MKAKVADMIQEEAHVEAHHPAPPKSLKRMDTTKQEHESDQMSVVCSLPSCTDRVLDVIKDRRIAAAKKNRRTDPGAGAPSAALQPGAAGSSARGQPSGGQPAGDTDSSSEEGGEEAAAALAAKRAKKREAKEDEADCQRILTSGVASYEKFAKTQVRTRPELNIQRDVVLDFLETEVDAKPPGGDLASPLFKRADRPGSAGEQG